MARRVLVSLAVVIGLVVAALVAGAAYGALKSPLQTKPNSNLAPESCSPGPCKDVRGFTIWVSNVRVDSNLVRMTVRFQNSSSATHASPDDLALSDSDGHTSGLVTDAAGCNTWQRHEFSGGQTFGPIDICFRVSNTTPPFTLRWSPDLGAFCCEEELPISPT